MPQSSLAKPSDCLNSTPYLRDATLTKQFWTYPHDQAGRSTNCDRSVAGNLTEVRLRQIFWG